MAPRHQMLDPAPHSVAGMAGSGNSAVLRECNVGEHSASGRGLGDLVGLVVVAEGRMCIGSCDREFQCRGLRKVILDVTKVEGVCSRGVGVLGGARARGGLLFGAEG